LSDLLKKNKKWDWSDESQQAFNKLKMAIMFVPVMKFLDFLTSFKVYIDASNRVVGGVLV